MQFETAQFASPESLAGELSCGLCHVPLSTAYFEVNGQKVCPTCRDAIESSQTQSSPVLAFFKAGIYGLLAGIAGCLLYYVVLAVTNMEIGLIAIVVGLMVGVAVRKGSGNRGGWVYQIMAMLITYGSIVTAFVPIFIKQFTAENEDARNLPIAVVAIIAWIFSWFAPFLSLPGNIIGVIIIGIGVYEAWQINRRHKLEISGPFALTSAVAPSGQAPPSSSHVGNFSSHPPAAS
jgi:hypothetical protein